MGKLIHLEQTNCELLLPDYQNNLPMVSIGNHNLIIREYRGQRVVTFDVIDKLHERPSGTARRNFSTNKLRFVEGVDYYVFKGQNGRKALIDGNYTNSVELPKSSNFNFCLFTQTGYLMLAKSLQDDLAWTVQRELVTGYFSAKDIAGNLFDVMRKMIDVLEQNQQTMLKTQQQLDITNEKITELNERTSIAIKPAWIPAHKIANQLKLFSLSNKPHWAIVASIAKQLGYKTNIRNWYEDEHIAIVAKQENGHTVWEIFYKPLAVNSILNWWDINKGSIYFVEYYKKNTKHKKTGEIRTEGYRIGGINYAIKKA